MKRHALMNMGFGKETLDIFFVDNPSIENSIRWRHDYIIFLRYRQ